MTQSELLEIIANGENSGVEFKREDVSADDLVKEIVAFANFKGGKIFVGVDDNRSISGINKTNIQTWIMDVVCSKIDPIIIPFYEEVNTSGGKVVIVSVSTGAAKPYAVKRNNRNDIYIRIGDTSRHATREQIIRMTQESGLFHSETLPVSGADFGQISLPLFLDYYKKNYGEDLNIEDADTIKEKLFQLDIIVRNEHQGLVSSIAGLILFGKNPGRFLPQHGMRIIHYRGTEQEVDSISDIRFTSHLASIKNNNEEILIPGLLDSIFLHLQEKLSVEKIASDGFTRHRVWQYPEEILRELIVNAIIHRDYTKANQNELLLFNDRIEIVSYGALPNTLTIEKIKAGQKYPRNPMLVRIAQDFGFMDHRGLGIRKKVLPILIQKGFAEPIFEATEDYFKISIKNRIP